MQNFNQPQSNSVSPEEARQVLSAWTNQQQARGVNPDVDSVQALAAGLGATESQVRQMLEDIRVQHRSQEIAAGILGEQQKERKRSDVNAAVGAAVALFILLAVAIAFFLLRPSAHEVTVIDRNLPPPIPGTAAPVAAPGWSGKLENVVHIDHDDGTSINIVGNLYTKSTPSGTLSLSGDEAVKAVQKDIDDLTKENASITAKGEITQAQKDKVTQNEHDIEMLKSGLDILKRASSRTAPPAAPGSSTD